MAAAGIAAAALVLAACGGSDPESSESRAAATTAASAAATSGASAAIDEAKAQLAALEQPVSTWPAPATLSKPVDVAGKTVFLVPIGDSVPVIQAIRTGVQQSLEMAGAKTELCDGKFNPSEIANCLKQATDKKVDAVMTFFIDYVMVPTAFDSVTSAGIPVLVGGAIPTGEPPADAPMAFLNGAEQNKQIVRLLAKAAVVDQGEELKALVLRLNDSKLTTDANDQAIAQIKEMCPTCVAEPVDFTTPTVDKLASAVSAALVANPGINAVIVSPEVYMEPAIAGINSAGLANQVKLYGANADLSGLQRVKDGTQVMDIAISPVLTGWQFTDGLMQLLAGDEVTVSTSIDGARIFTQENVSTLDLTPEAYMTTQWFGGDNVDFEQAYLNSWAGK